MKFIIGKKLEMTQRFASDGSVIPVTVVVAGPCVVTQVKTPERDGYRSVQLGYEPGRNLRKPQRGHLKELEPFRVLREFRIDDDAVFERGQVVPASVFASGDLVAVQGESKGHGFQGVVKRHGFHGHPTSHGHKDQTRMPGSIGSKRQGPVAPGKRMAGRMGGDTVTVRNLEIVEVDETKNLIVLKGALPGARGALLLLSAPGTMKLPEPKTETALEAAPEPAVAPEAEPKAPAEETAKAETAEPAS